jgi:hypothetical protein
MPLPTFVIAGERKCATTALHHWMSVHPDVYMHPDWDLNYFIEDELLHTLEWREGEAEASHWDKTHSTKQYSELFRKANPQSAIGEKSADLFYWRPAHARMGQYLSEAKIIIVLRHPVERAWSHYWNEIGKGKGRESLSFEDALASEPDRCQSSAYARLHLSYLRRGFYDESLESLLQHIEPSRVLVLTTERMKSQPKQVLQDVYSFIEVDPNLGLELAGTRHNDNSTQITRPIAEVPGVKTVAAAYNRIAGSLAWHVTRDLDRSSRVKKYVQMPFRKPATSISMPAQIRTRLLDIYTPHTEKLERLLGRQLDEWMPRVISHAENLSQSTISN